MKDYDIYLKDQIQRAESKWGRKWHFDELFKDRLKESWEQVRDLIGVPEEICCMGIRTGTEVFEFKGYYPESQVYGVDITENVKTIKTHLNIHISLQDFNYLPEDWADKFDLVFSNSLDHSYNIADTIKEWRRVTKPDGFLFLELSTTPANNIEHSFTLEGVKELFKDFDTLKLWALPDRNIITGLFRVY